MVGDKGYDNDDARAHCYVRGTDPIIPIKSNRKIHRPVDPDLYGLRNPIERFFNKVKRWRCITTRYNKAADSFMAFIGLASIKIWLRFVNRSSNCGCGTEPASRRHNDRFRSPRLCGCAAPISAPLS